MATHSRAWRPPPWPAAHPSNGALGPRRLPCQRVGHPARGTHRPRAATILRVGRNQLYQAVARGELGAVRIGRSIRIPKQALLDLLASTNPPTTSGDG
jgi:excisionase family DNA binding protein